MIIRSQDKKSIFNLESIKSIKVGVLSKSWAGESCDISIDKEVVGKYSTEGKAIKVLDMIQQEYGRHFYGQGGQMATADIYIQPFAFIPPKVFQMPSDEEVEV